MKYIRMDVHFCLEMLDEGLEYSKLLIFNTDQGSQFTSNRFTGMLEDRDIKISMDGRGCCFDNIFIARLWRSVKYEDIYLHDYQTPAGIYRAGENGFSEPWEGLISDAGKQRRRGEPNPHTRLIV